MGSSGRDGCVSLRCGAICTGYMAAAYNGILIYWFITAMEDIHPNDELHLVVTVLLRVLIILAAVHIAVSLLLVYGALKYKPDLVILWVILYISSCLVVTGLFIIGLAFLKAKVFLWIIFCNFIFIYNIVITFRFYMEILTRIDEESLRINPVRAL